MTYIKNINQIDTPEIRFLRIVAGYEKLDKTINKTITKEPNVYNINKKINFINEWKNRILRILVK